VKFRVTFKTPDALDAAAEEFGKSQFEENPSEDESAEYWAKFAKKFCEKFVKWGEYVTVEFDLLAGTATVVPTGG
jgi:hypothetical protein